MAFEKKWNYLSDADVDAQRAMARPQRNPRKPILESGNLSFTRFWNKFILRLASHRRQWTSWSRFAMIYSNDWLLKPQDWPDIAVNPPSCHGTFNQQYVCSCLVNYQNMPYQKVLKRWPNTMPAEIKQIVFWYNPYSALFRATQITDGPLSNFSQGCCK